MGGRSSLAELAAEFIKKCNPLETGVAYHNDADGISAAVLIAKTMRKIFRHFPEVMIPVDRNVPAITVELVKEVMKSDINKLIIVDVAADRERKLMAELCNHTRILVIDHHPPKYDLSKYNIIHINPHFKWKTKTFFIKSADYYCASKLVYDICSVIINIQELSWVAGIGLIGDNRNEFWEDFLAEVCKMFPSLKVAKNTYSYEHTLRKIAEIVDSGPTYASLEGGKVSLQAVLHAEKPEDILEGRDPEARKLLKWYNAVRNEMGKALVAWKARTGVESYETLELLFFEMKSGMDIHSQISTRLSNENPHLTILVLWQSDEVTYVSLRRQDGKVDCGKLARELRRGNGHRRASGAVIDTKDVNNFKQQVIEWIKEHPPISTFP